MTKQVFVRFVWCGKLTKKSVKTDAAFTLLRSFQFKTTINCICSIKALRVFLDRGSIAEMYVSERFPEFPRRPTVIRSIAPLVCTFVDDAHPPEKELDNYPWRRACTHHHHRPCLHLPHCHAQVHPSVPVRHLAAGQHRHHGLSHDGHRGQLREVPRYMLAAAVQAKSRYGPY